MQNFEYDFLVFIGRFQPFHRGHLAVIEQGLRKARQMIVLCGSAHQPRSTRNPWSVSEREDMVRSALSKADNQRVHIAPLMDIVYNDEIWVRNVQSTVQGLVTAHHGMPHKSAKVGLIGHSKDHSSFYLKLFPQWGSVEVENVDGISATPVREAIFGVNQTDRRGGMHYLESSDADLALPAAVREKLAKFCLSEDYEEIKYEHDFIAKYKRAWSAAPYAPTFVTVDAVVVQSGHVLLVERKARPGKGLLALPGGFVDQNEKLLDACLRELREETRLKVPAPVLRGSIKAQQVFDDPHRSARGRTITHAFHIELEPSSELPKVKGGDDARQAMWVPLAELDPGKLYEDHYFIIQEMTGI
ncbi:bifunctional nicotinamide-nucleotide adenylyltransferase/Nudix hydroxylase [Hahella chejuensis]|nr:bifunctional nicotinamide-nucleotide adenylyltransferase/Nudix hydroxylase [Hahella chejuensis]